MLDFTLKLKEEGTSKTVLKFVSSENFEELYNLANYEVSSIDVCGNTDGYIEFSTCDIQFLENLKEVVDLIDILETLQTSFFNDYEIQKMQDIAEYEECSIFELNDIDCYTVYDNYDDYYEMCDECLEDSYPEFFKSSIGSYFDYEKFHRDCD